MALLVIGPKDLPRVMRMIGQWLAKGRAMTRHVRAGFDTMMREAELEDMQKAWAAQNEAIMKASAVPDLGIKDALPALSAPNYSADEWMSPGPAADPATAACTPSHRRPSPKNARAGPSPLKPPRRRAAKPRKPRRKAEPQPTES